ncbi:hypothetical protein CEXT_614751 [Caerostris extrusa]|uniref:Uncharacterized protein n=1 Tax=Caerostris extrusa TaxID=172846 RepID=A0AAV4PB59_CAEEX|nr:hypothetical protein CEXT_614751 [Caerostris extrusa]
MLCGAGGSTVKLDIFVAAHTGRTLPGCSGGLPSPAQPSGLKLDDEKRMYPDLTYHVWSVFSSPIDL